jgi:hypothetical protein
MASCRDTVNIRRTDIRVCPVRRILANSLDGQECMDRQECPSSPSNASIHLYREIKNAKCPAAAMLDTKRVSACRREPTGSKFSFDDPHSRRILSRLSPRQVTGGQRIGKGILFYCFRRQAAERMPTPAGIRRIHVLGSGTAAPVAAAATKGPPPMTTLFAVTEVALSVAPVATLSGRRGIR